MSYLGRGLEQVDNISKLDNITFNGGTGELDDGTYDVLAFA